MLLEEELKVIYLAGNRKLTEALGLIMGIGNLKAFYHSDTLPLKGHTHFNRVTNPNSAIPDESIVANYIQSTTDNLYDLFHLLVFIFWTISIFVEQIRLLWMIFLIHVCILFGNFYWIFLKHLCSSVILICSQFFYYIFSWFGYYNKGNFMEWIFIDDLSCFMFLNNLSLVRRLWNFMLKLYGPKMCFCRKAF